MAIAVTASHQPLAPSEAPELLSEVYLEGVSSAETAAKRNITGPQRPQALRTHPGTPRHYRRVNGQPADCLAADGAEKLGGLVSQLVCE